MALKFPIVFEQAGPVRVPGFYRHKLRRRVLRHGVAKHLPGAWVGSINWAADEAARGGGWLDGDRCAGDVYKRWLSEYAGADAADMAEVDIRGRAELIAAEAMDLRVGARNREAGHWAEWQRLVNFVAARGGEVLPTKKVYTLESWRARVWCARWWRRQLRRMVARSYERGAIELGRVGAKAGQWYCSDRAVKRRVQQVKANNEAMKARVLHGADGQTMSVWDAAQLSVSNKAIRRGELMTRIRGCEEWADSAGLVGLFTTNTCPSRFHSQRKSGGKNPNYDGSTPGDAQKWLCKTWAACRAKLQREGLRVVGFRVAEPHHDGCPHWHMLLWCHAGDAAAVAAIVRAWWLKDSGSEPGAADYRVNIKAMIPGQASGYVAKYISKNIDDAHVTGHLDDAAPGLVLGPDLFGDMQVMPSQRVEAWASLWGIRQFQAVGMPPVGVWRELRRVDRAAAAGGSDAMALAWAACHRAPGKKADFAKYISHQGGAMLPRLDYRFCVRRIERDKPGRYEVTRESWACGVQDRRAELAASVLPNKRQRWGGEGFGLSVVAPPWTRLNNCTRGRLLPGAVDRLMGVACQVEGGVLDREGGYPPDFFDDLPMFGGESHGVHDANIA